MKKYDQADAAYHEGLAVAPGTRRSNKVSSTSTTRERSSLRKTTPWLKLRAPHRGRAGPNLRHKDEQFDEVESTAVNPQQMMSTMFRDPTAACSVSVIYHGVASPMASRETFAASRVCCVASATASSVARRRIRGIDGAARDAAPAAIGRVAIDAGSDAITARTTAGPQVMSLA